MAKPDRDMAAAYAELQNLLLESPDATDFLQQAALLAAQTFAGSSCGITLDRGGQVATVANSDDYAAQVDEIQYGRDEGPCLQALRTGEVVIVAELAQEQRWGDYRMHALAFGVRSSLSVPLQIDGVLRGALNLYMREPHAFGDREALHAVGFVRQAAAALTVVVRHADQMLLNQQLREALESRAIIDQAVGIIMGQRRITAAEAFEVLRAASQARNRKLAGIAAEVIQAVTGQPPTSARPFADPR